MKPVKNLFPVGAFSDVFFLMKDLPVDPSSDEITSLSVDLLVAVAQLAQGLIVACAYNDCVDTTSFFNICCELFLDVQRQLRSIGYAACLTRTNRGCVGSIDSIVSR